MWFRREYGEMVSADSPLFRDKFDRIKNQEGRGHHGHTRRDAKETVIPMTVLLSDNITTDFFSPLELETKRREDMTSQFTGLGNILKPGLNRQG